MLIKFSRNFQQLPRIVIEILAPNFRHADKNDILRNLRYSTIFYEILQQKIPSFPIDTFNHLPSSIEPGGKLQHFECWKSVVHNKNGDRSGGNCHTVGYTFLSLIGLVAAPNRKAERPSPARGRCRRAEGTSG